jgi:hypothetical protein
LRTVVRLPAVSVTTVVSVAFVRRRLARRRPPTSRRPALVVLMRMRPLPAAASVVVPRASLAEARPRIESVALAVQASLQLNS